MVINARVWQRSNRIIQIAHGLATAIRRGGGVRITEMSDLALDYACDVTWGGSVDLRPSRLWAVERCLHGALKRLLGINFKVPGVVTDWSYRDYDGVERYRDEIVRFFAPRHERVVYALQFAREFFDAGAVKVAVHIRRGDYREWEGGRYCYDNGVYLSNMRALAEALPGPKLFVLFSNEPIEQADFHVDGARVVVSKGNALDDHYLMSRCDYLFGPPSTFSRWGAYMGRRPLAFIESASQTLSLEDFKYISI